VYIFLRTVLRTISADLEDFAPIQVIGCAVNC
jgi:hypothetical protein